MSGAEALSLMGLSPDFTATDLKRSYRKLSKKYHPDVSGAESNEMFVKITQAYELLSSPRAISSHVLYTHQSIFTVVRA